MIELALLDRDARTVARRDARFQAVKSLESFDFDAIPGLNKKLVLDLARCEFVARRENVMPSAPAARKGLMPSVGSAWPPASAA